MKKFGKVVFNIFWIILIGLESAILNAVMGVACCVTIIGIPFGLQYFKFIKLAFMPAGRRVVTRFGKHPILNTLWLLFGGFEMFLLEGILGVICCVTIIGIPLGKQLFKIAAFNFAPFGAEIVWNGNYTTEKDSLYDYKTLFNRINYEPEKTLTVQDKTCSVVNYVTSKQSIIPQEQTIVKESKKTRKPITIFLAIITPIIVAFPILKYYINPENLGVPVLQIVISSILLVLLILTIIITNKLISYKRDFKLLELYKENYFCLFDLYPNNSPFKNIGAPYAHLSSPNYHNCYDFTLSQILLGNINNKAFLENEQKIIANFKEAKINSTVCSRPINDYFALASKIYKDPYTVISTPSGEKQTAIGALRTYDNLVKSEKKLYKRLMPLRAIIVFSFLFGIFSCVYGLFGLRYQDNIYPNLILGGCLFINAIILLIIKKCINNKLTKIYEKYLSSFFNYYDVTSSQEKEMFSKVIFDVNIEESKFLYKEISEGKKEIYTSTTTASPQ